MLPQSGRIGADEEIDDTKGKTTEQIDEMLAERELKAGTQILEMVSDTEQKKKKKKHTEATFGQSAQLSRGREAWDGRRRIEELTGNDQW